MRNTIFLAALLISTALSAQNDLGKTDDLNRIALYAYVDQKVSDRMPAGASEHLRNKLDQVASANGLSGHIPNAPFIISANVNPVDKVITPGAPAKHVLNLDVTIAIGNGIDGVKFGSLTKSVRGVGDNETKAYINALRDIKANDAELAALLESSKVKIIEYYNTRCDIIIQRAMGLSGQERFAEAMNELMAVPEVCSECHATAMESAGAVYRAKTDKECRASMAKAEGALAVGMYREAGEALATGITPAMPCYEEANKLMARIAERGKNDKDGRAWDLEMRKWNDKVDLREQEIEAWRQVGKAYGENQRGVNYYNVRGWW